MIETSQQVATTCQNVERLSVRAPNPALFGLTAQGVSATCRWVIACLIGILCGVCAGGIGFAAETQSAAPVILISVDTLRADRLSCYGFSGSRTSHINAMAHGGTLFSEVNAQVPLTLPSHVSLLTSTYPFANGIEDNGEQLGSGAVTLATVLKARGYRTAAFVGGFVLDRRFGLNQGFDLYESPFSVRAQGGRDPGEIKRMGEGGRWRRHPMDG